MTYKTKTKTKRIAMADQILWIRQRWGATWSVLPANGGFVATGSVRPDLLARQYRVALAYDGLTPVVHVLNPPLRRRQEDEPIPHTYPGDRLCLYHPEYREWTPRVLIANTIIPWISEWLYWYEIWLATGEWRGGGEHPEGGKPESG